MGDEHISPLQHQLERSVSLDDIEYKNGSKNHWRRTMWNRLREQIPDPRNAIVLYLPGSKDLDREEALRRGFKPWNLIAIERDSKVARVLRKNGVITINCGLLDVLGNWPAHVSVSSVIADMQCGVTAESNSILGFWFQRLCFDPVLVINLQRGRESGVFSEFIQFHTSNNDFTSNASQLDLSFKHRCLLLCQSAIFGLMMLRFQNLYKRNFNADDATDMKWMEAFTFAYFGRSSSVFLPTYRSTPRSPLFDSILIVKRLNKGLAIVPNKHNVKTNMSMNLPVRSNVEVKRCISAALAVRTMKMGH